MEKLNNLKKRIEKLNALTTKGQLLSMYAETDLKKKGKYKIPIPESDFDEYDAAVLIKHLKQKGINAKFDAAQRILFLEK